MLIKSSVLFWWGQLNACAGHIVWMCKNLKMFFKINNVNKKKKEKNILNNYFLFRFFILSFCLMLLIVMIISSVEWKTHSSDITYINRMYCIISYGHQRALLWQKNALLFTLKLTRCQHHALCPIVVNTSMGQVMQCLFIFEKHTKQCVNTIYLFYIWCVFCVSSSWFDFCSLWFLF